MRGPFTPTDCSFKGYILQGMTYAPELLVRLQRDYPQVVSDLQVLMLRGLSEIQQIQSDAVQNYVTYGVGRRLGVLRRSIENIFRVFPPETTTVLVRADVSSVEMSLHAFVINLSGIFDNWAWAFVHRHDLLSEIGGRRNVGIFKARTQTFLPEELQAYLNEGKTAQWHEQYAKNYRDSLAHRIPLYVPPAIWTNEDKTEYDRLEAEKKRLIQARDWERLDEVWAEQNQIGSPCHYFMHGYSEDADDHQVVLHPQIICDGMTVVEFGNKFYDSWENCTK